MGTETSISMTSGRTFSWYLKRLRVMEPGEVLARIGSQCGLAALSRRHRLGLTAKHADRLEFRRYQYCTSSSPQLPSWFYRHRPDEAACTRVLAGGLPEAGWNWHWE